MTITSKENEKLKLVRRLSERKHRERGGLFVTEGEDLLEAGRAAGAEPRFVLTRAGEDLRGEEVDPALLDAVSRLGSGTRAIAVWPTPATRGPTEAPRTEAGEGPWVYLHGVGDPGNVGSIVRSAGALGAAGVALGPGCADPYGPKAVRASMGAIFTATLAAGDIEATPAPRLALVAHGGDPGPPASAATVCLGAERDGLPDDVVAQCEHRWSIPVRPEAAESLNVAAAAAIALHRIGSAPAVGQTP